MTSEDLIMLAEKAILHWTDHHSSPCFLSIQNGTVVAASTKDMTQKCPNCLILTPFSQCFGFSNARWHSIGTALFNLYTKEVACQARQKH